MSEPISMIFGKLITSYYSEHTHLFLVPQIHHTKWRHLAKVNN